VTSKGDLIEFIRFQAQEIRERAKRIEDLIKQLEEKTKNE